ncbi:MAG: hemerythrin domain-containing protein [Niabella sp.]
MKRNENIIPLSRDHHDGLLFCWKIRQGIKLDVELTRIQAYARYFWEQHLRQHFYEEENILFKYQDDEFTQRAMKEHTEIKELIETITNANIEKRSLQHLADLVDKHIRYEERELFPHLESTLTAEQLTEVGAQLQLLHAVGHHDDFTDTFWQAPG